MVAVLILSNHINAADYGYEFFEIACETLKEFQKTNIICMTTAVQLAFAGKKEIKRFLEEET